MTCIIPRPSPEVLFGRIRDQFSANVLGGGAVVPESNEWWVVTNDYFAQETIYSLAEMQWKERDPRQCCCDNLVAMAADRGVYPYPAMFAQGFVVITGTPGTALSSNMEFLFGSNTYRADTTSSLPTVMPAAGNVTVRVVATEPGPAGNSLGTSGTHGTFTNAPENISNVATACGTSFCNGRAAETCEEFRTRYIDRLAMNPIGRLDWAFDIMREYPCLTRICLRNCGCCENMYELQLYAFFDGTFPHGIPPVNVADDLKTWFFGAVQGLGQGRAPFNVRGSIYVPTPAAIDVVVQGLDCLVGDQATLIKSRIAQLFAGLCPGAKLCLRQFELVVAQVAGPSCDFHVLLTIAEGVTGIRLSDCGDIEPDCDVLPVLGSLTIPSSVCG